MTVFSRGVENGITSLATARWAGVEGVRDLARPGGPLSFSPGRVWLGVTPDEERLAVGWQDDRHLVTLAGSRGGKGRSAIIPNLLVYPGSVVCIDPKGENASATAEIRRLPAEHGGLGQEVFVFDPFRVSGVDSSLMGSFNPLAALSVDAVDIVEQVGTVADSLVVRTESKDAHWDESAQALIEAVMLHMLSDTRYAERCTLATARDLLVRGDDESAERRNLDLPDAEPRWTPVEALLNDMRANTTFPDAVGGMAQTILDMGPEERGSVLSTARRNTKFLDGQPVREVLANGPRPFRFSDLKGATSGVTVYLCLPARYLSTHARWLRLMVGSLMSAMERSRRRSRSGCPVLAIFDEFPVLGHMKVLETAVGYMAGYDLRIWAILQDISQLKRDYPQSWETFLGNAGLIQFFANSDVSTLEFLSKRIGETEVVRALTTVGTATREGAQDLSERQRQIESRNHGALSRPLSTVSRSIGFDETQSHSDQVFRTPLINPDELALEFRRSALLQGLILADLRPMQLRRVNHDQPEYQEVWAHWRSEAHRWRSARRTLRREANG